MVNDCGGSQWTVNVDRFFEFLKCNNISICWNCKFTERVSEWVYQARFWSAPIQQHMAMYTMAYSYPFQSELNDNHMKSKCREIQKQLTRTFTLNIR